MNIYSRSLSAKFVLNAFIVLSLILLVIGSCILVNGINFRKTAIETNGEVVHLVYNNEGMQAPVIDFKDAEGKSRTFTSNVYSSNSDYRVGDITRVLYDPKDPSNASVAGSFWLAPGILLGLGSFIFLLMLGIKIMMRKNSSVGRTVEFEKTFGQ